MTPEIISAIAQVLSAYAWPIVVVVSGYLFRQEIRELLGRIRKGGGVEFDPPYQSARPSAADGLLQENTGSQEAAALPLTPATRKWVKIIESHPPLANISDLGQRAKMLTLLAARAVLFLQFEQAEGLIWRSQLAILRHLNGKSTEESLDALQKLFYEPAAKEFPEMFKAYDFPSYMSFLSRFDLIEIEDGKGTKISATGAEYLIWRDQQQKAERIYG